MKSRERDQIGRRALENGVEIPDLEARPGRDQQGRVADPAMLPHHRGHDHHAVGREGDMLDKAEGTALSRIMRLEARTEERRTPLLEIPLLLGRENPVIDDEAGRFFMQADEQPAIRRPGQDRFVEVPRQDDFAPARHFANCAADKKFVHAPTPIADGSWLTKPEAGGVARKTTVSGSSVPGILRNPAHAMPSWSSRHRRKPLFGKGITRQFAAQMVRGESLQGFYDIVNHKADG